jgi:hypothetical protein
MTFIFIILFLAMAVFLGHILRHWYETAPLQKDAVMAIKAVIYVISFILILGGGAALFLGLFCLFSNLSTMLWDSYYSGRIREYLDSR